MEVIDCQWHWYPREFAESKLGRGRHPLWSRDGDALVYEPTPGRAWRYGPDYLDLDRQLEIMAAAGIDAVLASPVVVGDGSLLEPAADRAACEQLNELFAGAARANPGVVHGLAVLPMQDPAAAVEVLDDAISRLGLKGVLLHSNIAGQTIAGEASWPVYARAQELGIPLFLHPTHAFGDQRLADFKLEPPLGYMFDTTVAALSLILAGVLDAFPDLAIVHPHLGGTLPYLVDRVDVYASQGRWPQLERPVKEYLTRFHTDTVNHSPGALATATDLYGTERLLFSSDHPYFGAADEVAFVREHVAAADHPAVFAGNARRLLGLDEERGA